VPSSGDQKLHFSIPVPRGTQRFRELILYVSKKSENDPHFGAIKLNKILYYSDFRAFERFGVPITGTRYFRLPKGPAPKAMIPIHDELQREGALKIEIRYIGDYRQKRTIALRSPILEHFTGDELLLVDEVINDLWNQNAKEVSDASHDIRWRTLRHGDEIPYEFAFLSNDPISESEIAMTKAWIDENGWEHK